MIGKNLGYKWDQHLGIWECPRGKLRVRELENHHFENVSIIYKWATFQFPNWNKLPEDRGKTPMLWIARWSDEAHRDKSLFSAHRNGWGRPISSSRPTANRSLQPTIQSESPVQLQLPREGDGFHMTYPLVNLQIAMENGPFIDGLPIKNGDFPLLC